MTEEHEHPEQHAPKKRPTRVKLHAASGEPVKGAKSVPLPESETSAASSRAKVTLERTYRKLDDKEMSAMYGGQKQKKNNNAFILWSVVGLLLIAGIVLLVMWMMGGNGPKISLFATETPTPTITPSPTNTPLPPTATSTPTQTLTPTPDKPFEYIVQENDNLFAIASLFDPGNEGEFLMKILELNPDIPGDYSISLGQKIMIPNPGYELPTATPIPTGLPYGTKLEYIIQPGDTLNGIASLFNSTAEDIIKENDITDANALYVGQLLTIRANIVTPTPKPAPTITAGPSPTAPSPYTPTPTTTGG